MKARQFVNAVTGYSLGRIKLKNNLFYPSTAEAQAVAMAAANDQKLKENKQANSTLQEEDYDMLPLPRPKLTFQPSHRLSYRDLKFLPFYGTRGGEGNFLCVDESGHGLLYNADACKVGVMPGMGTPNRYYPVSCSVTHAHAADPARPDVLYVMDSQGCSFQALVYGDPSSPWGRSPISLSDRQFMYGYSAWHWRTLPTPRVEDIVDADSSLTDDADSSYSSYDDDADLSFAQCYGLLHGQEDAGATICVSFSLSDSAGPDGTYCFDTASQEWSKAGDWTLPFCSRAHHVPELGDGLLFGLEHVEPNRFCAIDISGIKMNRAPVLRHAWMEHAEPPTEWTLTNNNVVYLGAGRFCIHRSFDIMEECGYGDWTTVDTVVLLTGVEVVRAPGSSKLRMVKHKSRRLDRSIESLL